MGELSRGYYTLDQALSAVGFGKFQSLALVFAGAGWFTEAMELTLLSFIGPILKSEWSLSPAEESFLTTAVFGGMLIGAYFWGCISDARGRRIGIRGVAAVIAASGLLSSFSPDYKSLVALRFFLGFGAGGAHMYMSWFLEFISSSGRGAWLLSLTVFWIFGELLEAALAWIIIPRLGWRWLLALSSVPSIMVSIASYFAPESPRYLFMKGKTEEAVSVLEKVASMNSKTLPSGVLMLDNETFSDQEDDGISTEETQFRTSTKKQTNSLKKCLQTHIELFSPEFLKTTILLWILNFVHTFAYYGLQLMISSLSSEQSDCSSSSVNRSNHLKSDGTTLYANSFITSLAEFPGLIIAVAFVEWIGRKRSMTIMTMLAVVTLLPLLSDQNGAMTTNLLITSRMLMSGAFAVLFVYAREVYPTSIRGSGSGLSTSFGRIGGMVCPLIAVGMVRSCQVTLAAVVFGLLMFVSGFCILFFPFETKGKALADVVGSKD